MNICRRFDRAVKRDHDVAIEDPHGDRKSYQQLRSESGYAAALLRDQGIEPGDRICVHLPNDSAYLSVVLGIWRAGAVAVPIDGRWDAPVTDHVIADLEPSMLITTDEYAERVRSRTSDGCLSDVPIAKIDPGAKGDLGVGTVERPSLDVAKRLDEDVANVVYTSGTTGTPKGVIHTHRNVTAAIEMSIDWFDLTASDVSLAAVPLDRSPGIYGSALPALCVGGSVVVQPDWDPEQWAELVAECSPRLTLLKPEQVTEAADIDAGAGDDTASLDICVITTGLLRSQSTVNDFRDTYDVGNVINYYGQTESLSVSMGTLAENDQPNFIGNPTDVVETKVVDVEHGRPVPPGNEGELLVRGDVVTPGYWNRNNAASERFTDGWLHTEDVVHRDEDGDLFFVDRVANTDSN